MKDENTTNSDQIASLSTVDPERLAIDMYNHRVAVANAALNQAGNVEELTNELYTCTTKSRRVTESVAAREVGIYSDVCAAMNGDKPKYSNDGARKAAAADIAAKDAILVAMRQDIVDADVGIARLRERISCITSQINIRRAFLQGS